MRYDAIVVGGGMAGLTAAAFLRKAGKSVLILEKNEYCGGLVHSFSRNGFMYDGGVRALLDSGIILPMLKELGLKLELVRSKVSLGIEDSFINVETAENLADYEGLLKSLYPENGAEVERIILLIRKIMKNMDVLYGIENPLFRNLLKDLPYLFGTLFPWLFRFVATIGRIYRMSGPVEEFLQKLTRNRSLQDIIDQHFFRRTPTFFAMSYFRLYLDYLYPPGGTGVLADTLYEFNRSRGSEIRLGACVVSVDPHGQTVRDGQGNEYGYRTLLWAADLKTLYRSIDPDRILPARLKRRFTEKQAQLAKHRGGDSVFTLFLGVDLPPAFFAAKSHGHLFYTPDRRGLNGIHTSELDAMLLSLKKQIEGPFDGGETAPSDALALAERKALVYSWLRRFCAYTSYEISIPALRIPLMAPENQTGLIVSVLFEHELCRLLQVDGWFEEFKSALEDEILTVIDRTLYPGLSAHVIDRFSSSPLTIERTVGSSNGAITGWAFTGGKLPAVQKIQQSTRSVHTPIPRVFQAGQWSYSPAGVPIAVLTGKIASTAMLKALRIRVRAEKEYRASP